MRRFLFFGFVLFLLVICNTCSHENESSQVIPNAVTDVDGNTYDAVRIGNQVWMKSNLRTKHYRNGLDIPYFFPNGYDSIYQFIRHLDEWPHYELELIGTSFPSYNPETHGLYYPAEVGEICPKGWHVPTKDEWRQLIDFVESTSAYYIQGERHVAKALASTTGWELSSREGAPGCRPEENNTTGFSAFPTGKIRQIYDSYYLSFDDFTTTLFIDNFLSTTNLGQGYFFNGGICYGYVDDYQDYQFDDYYHIYFHYYGDFGLYIVGYRDYFDYNHNLSNSFLPIRCIRN